MRQRRCQKKIGIFSVFSRQRAHKGMALIIAYSVVTSLCILSVAMIQKSIAETNQMRIKRLQAEAFYLAEAGLEQAVFELITKIANYESVTGVPGDISADPGNTKVLSGLSSNFTIRYGWIEIESADTKKTKGGIVTFGRLYRVTSVAAHAVFTNIKATSNQIFSRNKTYTFQHAVFYADDLEVLPGKNMTLSGRVHSNKDMYLWSDQTLKIDSDYIYSAGNIYNARKDSSSSMAGNVQMFAQGSSYPRMYDASLGDTEALDSDRADWAIESQNRWKGNVKSSVHGVTALAVPVVGSIQPDGYYAQNAQSNGLKITKRSTGALEIYANGIAKTASDFPSGTFSETILYNKRENTSVALLDIDMAKLNASGLYPANGLLYATRQDSTAGSPNAVRIKNGAQINAALTVVTNDPLYIQGNYNVTNKKPAAVICDSVNILSSNWVDAKGNTSGDPFSGKVAADTTVNTAFIAGVKATTGPHYSGGLENYLRLHEDWGGSALTVRGSFVELWESSIATGDWQYGSPYYTAPTRNWDYDTSFNNEANLPPFTPSAIEAERVAWWQG